MKQYVYHTRTHLKLYTAVTIYVSPITLVRIAAFPMDDGEAIANGAASPFDHAETV